MLRAWRGRATTLALLAAAAGAAGPPGCRARVGPEERLRRQRYDSARREALAYYRQRLAEERAPGWTNPCLRPEPEPPGGLRPDSVRVARLAIARFRREELPDTLGLGDSVFVLRVTDFRADSLGYVIEVLHQQCRLTFQGQSIFQDGGGGLARVWRPGDSVSVLRWYR